MNIMIGIYKIENKVNGKIYVGQSIDINARWKNHITLLNKGNHHNDYLQKSWNKYGENNFEFSIIEECDLSDLNCREIYWIDYYNSYIRDYGYNLTLGGEGNKQITSSMIDEMCDMYDNQEYTTSEIADHFNIYRKTAIKYLQQKADEGLCTYDSEEARLRSATQKVVCLNTKEIFDSIISAEEKYEVHGIPACCKHKLNCAGKDENGKYLLWMYLSEYESMTEEEIDKYIYETNMKLYGKSVVCLNTKDIFENSQSACDWCGLKHVRSIQLCCTHMATYGGTHPDTNEKLVWRYYEEYVLLDEVEINQLVSLAQIPLGTKSVVCLNNNKIFETPVLASNWANTTPTKIKNCCRNAANNAGNDPISNELLSWAYLDDYQNMSDKEISDKLFLTQYSNTTPKRTKTIICVNNSMIFKSQKEAGKWCNLSNPSQIGYSIRKYDGICGIHPDTKEPLLWMYENDYKKLSQKQIQEKMMTVYNKQIVCVNTKNIFNSYTEAANFGGISSIDGIKYCCEGNQNTCGKHPVTKEPLKWMYRSNYIKTYQEESVA